MAFHKSIGTIIYVESLVFPCQYALGQITPHCILLMTRQIFALEMIFEDHGNTKTSCGSEIITGHWWHNPKHLIMSFSAFLNHSLIKVSFHSSFPIHKRLITLLMNLVTQDAWLWPWGPQLLQVDCVNQDFARCKWCESALQCLQHQ